jgi:hypothetical protein
MPVILLPRISPPTVDRILDRLRRDRVSAAIEDIVDEDLRQRTYAAIGGRTATQEELQSFRRSVHGILMDLRKTFGLPASMRAEFDVRCAAMLADSPLFKSGEALRDDVWSFMSAVLLRDVVHWRFQGLTADRYQGGVRNAFQRLWQRARAFDRGADHPERWQLVQALSEDACVQILERPSIASSPGLSRAIAEGWLRCSERVGKSHMEPIMRRAIRNLRISNQVILLECLEEAELDARIDRAFADAAI